MSGRTALEIAGNLACGHHGVDDIAEAAYMLRHQHAEIARLTLINSALVKRSNSNVIENARQAEEIERLTAELAKDDPAQLWAEIHTLRCKVAGPDGFETWQDAAVHERKLRVKAEGEIERLTLERSAAIAAAVADEREACAMVCEKSSFPAFTARCFAADIRTRAKP